MGLSMKGIAGGAVPPWLWSEDFGWWEEGVLVLVFGSSGNGGGGGGGRKYARVSAPWGRSCGEVGKTGRVREVFALGGG